MDMRSRKTGADTGFFGRRRMRQRAQSMSREHMYTFDLAALYLQLLVAMAAIDDDLRIAEEEEVLSFIDRASLGVNDVEKLEQLARSALRNPPRLDTLLERIASLAKRPAIARQICVDLARVAAADSREDPRETRLLQQVCDALGIEQIEIKIDNPREDVGHTLVSQNKPSRRGGLNRARVQAAVRKALEASYREHS